MLTAWERSQACRRGDRGESLCSEGEVRRKPSKSDDEGCDGTKPARKPVGEDGGDQQMAARAGDWQLVHQRERSIGCGADAARRRSRPPEGIGGPLKFFGFGVWGNGPGLAWSGL